MQPRPFPKILTFHHERVGVIQFHLDQKAFEDVNKSFNEWKTEKNFTGLSRFLNKINITLDKNFYRNHSGNNIFPQKNFEYKNEIDNFLKTKQAAKQACCEFDKNNFKFVLNPWLKKFIQTTAPILTNNNLTALENYFVDIYRLALEILLDKHNNFQTWVKDIFGDNNLPKINSKDYPILILQFVAAIVLWLHTDFSEQHAKFPAKFLYINVIISNAISSINHDPIMSGNTALFEFIKQALAKRLKNSEEKPANNIISVTNKSKKTEKSFLKFLKREWKNILFCTLVGIVLTVGTLLTLGGTGIINGGLLAGFLLGGMSLAEGMSIAVAGGAVIGGLGIFSLKKCVNWTISKIKAYCSPPTLEKVSQPTPTTRNPSSSFIAPPLTSSKLAPIYPSPLSSAHTTAPPAHQVANNEIRFTTEKK